MAIFLSTRRGYAPAFFHVIVRGMWIPEVVFCIATSCYLASAPPTDSEDACRAFVADYMVPVIIVTVPGATIHVAGCRRADTQT
jgi:hypothetical protein